MEFLEVIGTLMAGVGHIEMLRTVVGTVAPYTDVGYRQILDCGFEHSGVPVGHLEALKAGLGESRDLATFAGLVTYVGELVAYP